MIFDEHNFKKTPVIYDYFDFYKYISQSFDQKID